jgi:hypothetical protein
MDATLVFNELMYNSPDNSETREFVEFHNQMGVDLDVSDWRVADGISYRFPVGTIVPAGGYIVLAKDPAIMTPVVGQPVLGPFEGRLSNSGERLELRDRNQRLMDVIEYDDQTPWPLEADGAGASLAKRQRLTRSDEPTHWGSSILVGGTPGRANFSDQSPAVPPVDLRPENVQVVLNEVAALGTSDFFVELANRGPQSQDLSGMRLISGGTVVYTFPAGSTLGGSGLVAISTSGQGLPVNLEWVALASADGNQVLDAVDTSQQAQGRYPDARGPFRNEQVATPGRPNTVALQDAVVINEIMYNYRPEAAKAAIPPALERTPVVTLNGTWRYNESGEALPMGWEKSSHALGGNWKSGPGLFGFETNPVVPPGIGTTFVDPITTGFITYYFETDFQVTAEQLAGAAQLFLRHVVDDGAVFYLNGVELTRFNMPAGPVDSTTVATATINNATGSDPIAVPAAALVAGKNRLSVEVHQRTAGSNDVLFGAELSVARQLDNGTPPKPFLENPEEWIELYNRSSKAVDLGGWKFDQGVDYEFPAGTVIGPGEYRVVARDAETLRASRPAIAPRVLGSYDGQLSNGGEWLRLLDANGNPADELRYHEDGQWPAAADGEGSSLELRDPLADNANGNAWSASEESHRAVWQTYSYRGVAARSSLGPDGRWQEFVLGMLDDGEVLLDDIQVIQDPGGQAINLIQNGTFEADVVGETPAKWRAIGNHRQSLVVMDPDNPANKAWKLVATGATEHMHNHAETTLKIGDAIATIQNGTEYEIRYRAKWVTGSNQLHSRLYFNRLARTTPLQQPDRHGTPGEVNSTRVANIGPVYQHLIHAPVVPEENQPVTVSVDIMDPQRIASATVWYSVEGGTWQQVPMTFAGGDRYQGVIPGQAAARVVQFYVEALDGNGAVSTFPQRGKDSRALYKVQDGLTSSTGIHNLRLVVTPADGDFLHADVELMGNGGVGATVIHNETHVYYDVNLRTSGSQRARPYQPRLSFAIGFHSDQQFRDVYSSITLDRSESVGYGQREHIYHHAMNRVGGLPTEYHDLFHIITPKREHTGGAEAQLARYSDLFLDEQYENGGSGQLYEYELTYFPTTTKGGGPEGRKLPQPDDVAGVNIRYISPNKEDYRWAFLNKNNRQQDDYSQLIEFTKVMSLPTTEFAAQASTVLDVDQWLRAFAFGVMTGHGDNYLSDGAQHNLQMYVRPTDGRVLLFPHDLDAFFDPNRPLIGNEDLRRLLRDPTNSHMYYGHVNDMIETAFNGEYMKRWTDYWKTLLPAQNFSQHQADLVRRTNVASASLLRTAPKVDFALTAAPATVDTPFALLTGTGWVNVREIRLARSNQPLRVQWTSNTGWQVEVPLTPGPNAIQLDAYDFQGKPIGSVKADVATTATMDLKKALRITEVNYHPSDPTREELTALPSATSSSFEFIELTNVSALPINLLGTQFAAGLSTVFPSTELAPGESAVLVSRADAFRLRYGSSTRILGDFGNKTLSDSGEQITLYSPFHEPLASFSYRDADDWPAAADGEGYTLSLLNPAALVDAMEYGQGTRWTASERRDGSPGRVLLDGDMNLDLARNASDIDRLYVAIRAQDQAFDLDRSGATDQDDMDHLVRDVLRSTYGDSNFDGRFGSSDLVQVFARGQYEDGVRGNSGWADGDWNGDGDFDSRDFVLAMQEGDYEAKPAAVDWVAASLAQDRKVKK